VCSSESSFARAPNVVFHNEPFITGGAVLERFPVIVSLYCGVVSK